MPGLLARLFGRTAFHQREEVEKRRSVSSVAGWSMGPLTAGNTVSARIAEDLSTVVSCVNVIASTIGTLPATVYREIPGGREPAPLHPVTRLIQQPNSRQTWPDFIEWLVAQTLLHGNGLAIIDYDGAGRPTALVPVPWPNVLPQLLPTGELAFDIQQMVFPWGGTGQPRRYLESEVLLVRDRSDDGYLGRSRLSRAPQVLRAALGLQTYSSTVWDRFSSPSGVLKMPGSLSPEAAKRVGEDWSRSYGGAGNSGKVPVLEAGLEFQAISHSPEDSEVLASRRFSTEEIARLFGVPPPLVGDYTHNTFTNSATAGAWFGQFTILPLVRKIEAAFLTQVFADPGGEFHVELDMSGLTRGDFAARWQAYQIALQNGVLSPNEVREAEGWNPHPDGDALRVTPQPQQSNATPASA